MCPLRLILIFLSATLAGFFVLKNLKSQSEVPENHSDDSPKSTSTTSIKQSFKFLSAIDIGFWTFVDMASGFYLWRNVVSSLSSKCSSS